MRYGVAIPHANRFASPEAIRSVARAVEDLGFDSIWVSDHIVVPEGHGYIPEHMDEPLAVLAYLAGQTTNLTIGTSVLIVPYRDPVFTAKFLSTVDVLSAGRLVVGVGIGWLREEFDALSASYPRRASVTDDSLRVFKNLWETETSTYEGRFKSYERIRMFPKASPNRRGSIPLWVGGNSPGAIRRAATLGDGWHPINLGPDDFARLAADYTRACEEAGRPAGPVCLRHMPGRQDAGRAGPLTGTPDDQAADIRAYAAGGLDELMLSPAPRSVTDLVSSLRQFVREVVPRV